VQLNKVYGVLEKNIRSKITKFLPNVRQKTREKQVGTVLAAETTRKATNTNSC